VGETIILYGRSVFLYDCDEFTREFYKRYTGVLQPNIRVEDPKPVHVKLTYPPHTGFGTEEDSLASCLHLTPRAPRRDINKLMGDQGKVLRFQGQMMNNKMEDSNRRFVVAIYLADDSVGVWELRQRNSGHAEGKFAFKSKKSNPATGKMFTPTDFEIGGVVEINCTPFRLLRGDDATLSFMEKYCADFPCADIRLIGSKLNGLQGEIASKGQTGEINPDDVKQLAEERLSVVLGPHEMVTLRRACGEIKEQLDDDVGDDAFDAAEAPSAMITEKLLLLLDTMSNA